MRLPLFIGAAHQRGNESPFALLTYGSWKVDSSVTAELEILNSDGEKLPLSEGTFVLREPSFVKARLLSSGSPVTLFVEKHEPQSSEPAG